MTNKPVFAVVGHPNKGKSSIVSTLAHNDNIAVSSRSGTTVNADEYEITTANGQYTLIDTPGFQRPNKVLHWLQQHCSNASERAGAVSRFVRDPDCQAKFHDEVSLLKPIVAGAAILYVVDGSRPYSVEYEAEMEILRWTGQPSMALINPIENSHCVDEWQNALAQYFKSVRVFNPMSAGFDRHTELLKLFAYLNPNWTDALNTVTEDLANKRDVQRTNSIKILTHLVNDVCYYQHCQKALSENQAKQLEQMLMNQFKQWLKKREQDAINALLANYAHYKTQVSIEQLALPPDLFDCDQWYAWGLNKKQLMYAAAMAGAVGGAAFDAVVAGHSFMLGALGGSLLGAGTAWFGADRLTNIKVKGLPLGGYQACVGPIKNRNFPYVIIGRFVYLYRQIAQRNHANRNALTFSASDFQEKVESLEKSEQKALHQACARLSSQKPVDGLESVLLPFFKLD